MLDDRAPHGGDLRPPARPAGRGGASTTAACSTRAPTIARSRSCSRAALERWGAWQELRELIDEEAGRAVDPGDEAGAAAPQREAGRGEAGQPRPRHRDAARGDGRRPDRSRHRRRAGAPARAPRSSGTSWPTTWRRSLDRISDRARGATRSGCGLARGAAREAGRRRGGGRSLRRGPRAHAGPAERGRRAGALAAPSAERHRVAVDPRAGLPAVGRSRQAGRARWTRSSSPSTTATDRVRILREMAEIHQRLGAARARVRLPQPRLAGRRRVGRDAGRDGGARPGGRPARRAGRRRSRRAPSRRAIPTCRRSCGR